MTSVPPDRSTLAAPPYGSGTLADLLPSAAVLLGAAGFADALGLGSDATLDPAPEAVTVLLIDGLGWEALREHADITPHLSAMASRALSTTVPSTTPTALASLGTGMPPGAHGIVGAAFHLPDEEHLLHPLTWRGDAHPIAVQPEPTIFERLTAQGVPVLSVGASAYAESGLTRAVLRGGEYADADDQVTMVEALARHRRGLAYAYLPDLDKTGHVHGVDSRAWRQQLRAVDELVGRVLDRLGGRHRFIVTADHGMVDCPPESRIPIEDLPGFADVTAVGGEPRMRHVYTRPGAAAGLAASWADLLGDRAWVLTRVEAVASGILGAVDDDYAERLGDVVVLARGNHAITSQADSIVSSLIGQHGSVTADEIAIPLLQSMGTRDG